jgi:GT2 family glycosyltransferase
MVPDAAERSIQWSARVRTLLLPAGYGTTTCGIVRRSAVRARWRALVRRGGGHRGNATVPTMPLDVEVMIVSFGSAPVLGRCLASVADRIDGARVAIREHSGVADLEALHGVADASSLTIRIEHDPTNPGFGAGCNALANGSTADWFLFLNPDAEIVAWHFDDVRPPSSTIIGPMFTADAPDHFGRHYRIRDEVLRSWLRRPGQVPDGTGFVSGAALLVDAEAFRSVGGFDENYFLFFQDIDLCLRANRVGIGTVVEPNWSVRHDRGHSTNARFREALVWSYESACLFHGRHGSPVWLYRWYVACDATARAAIHLVRRDESRRVAYTALAQRAVSDSVRGGRSRSRGRGRPSSAPADRS